MSKIQWANNDEIKLAEGDVLEFSISAQNLKHYLLIEKVQDNYFTYINYSPEKEFGNQCVYSSLEFPIAINLYRKIDGVEKITVLDAVVNDLNQQVKDIASRMRKIDDLRCFSHLTLHQTKIDNLE